MTDHPLDRPVWNALAGRQAEFAVGGPLAKRFRADVEPFAAAVDDRPASLDALAALIRESGEALHLQAGESPVAETITVQKVAAGVQMVAVERSPGDIDRRIVRLGDADVEEMIALATMTEPGPFLENTHRLGAFWGIRDGGRLVAMAGERLKLDRYSELSGVCTHPDYRGRGYAATLSIHVTRLIFDRGETPFLHAYADNAGAVRLYEKLGFRHRADMVVRQLVARMG